MTKAIASLLILICTASAQERNALSIAAQFARTAGDCAERAATEHFQSIPLPVKTEKGLRYRLMYYPASSESGKETDLDKRVFAPAVVAQFDGEGREVTCKVRVSFPKTELLKPLGAQLSADTMKMSRSAYEHREAELYAAIEKAAKFFFDGKNDAKAASQFRVLFAAHAEPGLLAHYKAMAPDFFAWVAASEK